MDWLEAYHNGHTADLTGFTSPAPPWLLQLGWASSGLWVEITQADLKQALPTLQLFTIGQSNLRFAVIEPPEEQALLSIVFRQIEESNFPLIALRSDMYVTCEQCFITTGITGAVELVGSFYLTDGKTKSSQTLRHALPRRLELTRPPGSAYFSPAQLLISGFTVPASISGLHPAIHDHAVLGHVWQEDQTVAQRPSIYKSLKAPKFSFFRT